MVNSTTSPNNYKFEQAHIDWLSLRTQMTIGLLSIFFLCLINFIPFWPNKFGDLANNGFIDFTLYFASCSLVALISLAIADSGGERNGAGYAIWTALLFAISPWQAIISLPGYRISRLIGFFIVLSVFLFINSKQKTSKAVALVTFLLALGCCFCFENHHVVAITPLKQLIFAEYMLAALILCGRALYHALSWRTASVLILYLANAVIATELLVRPSLIMADGAVLSVILPLACLPALGAAPIQINRVYSTFGLIALALIAITYELAFVGY